MTYTPEQVERLLPTIWGGTWAWGQQNPQIPDPDMPRATSVASHSGTYWAHLADIRAAWRETFLTRELRVALFLSHACGWTQEEIAEHEAVSQRAISKRLARALELLTNHLNGYVRWGGSRVT
ncbi:sigma factor-like helix-turn-helix DNA-binding protein [Umezawaea sp. Da 62-37]|uniref:sigma factor-like helix-turn-helix DNA-binding protein n=1 Tax=Umezawaea sp. Da 62-37 TaxID=3075927 RepID=UPI0028F6E490|nr:sigma factor-like helix-turn-helix DNA-binding protein [Umezawaea sp. Da 62-37]WNV90342.1 sigma factor-like helix-turn-helix DNA-binding protein [Umezawaea sp. Da 62-37]